ncbi:MAG: hypothetical protein R3B45_03830 [Bdellovibrionota bacterium]
MAKFFFVAYLGLFLISKNLFAFEGLYEGVITLNENHSKVISMQASFVNTGETVRVGDGDVRNILQGSFVLDDQGGPFSFAQVSLDIDNSWLEMKYYRPQFNPEQDQPNLRFFGKITADFSVTGTVYSSMWGNVGKFSLKKTARSVFRVLDKFDGDWIGSLQSIEDGERKDIKISISTSVETRKNPFDFEMDYTYGKTASLQVNGVTFALNKVYIDYLRRKLILAYSDGNDTDKMVFELKADFSAKKLTGVQSGIWAGKNAVVVLLKERKQ